MSRISKWSIYSYSSFLLILSSALQFGDYFFARYFLPMLSLVLMVVILLFSKKAKKDNIVKSCFLLHFIVFSLFVCLSFIGYSEVDEIVFDIVKLFLAFGLSFFVFYSVYYASIDSVRRTLIATIVAVLFVYFIDTMYRFSGFNITSLLRNFYIYKVDSLFFVDTNSLALYGVFYFSMIYYYFIYHAQGRRLLLRFSLFFIFVFILLTFSRAAISSLFFIFLFDWYFKRGFNVKFIFSLFLMILMVFFIPALILLIASDGSGLTKVITYTRFWDLLWLQDLRGALFGYGINEGNYTYSYREGAYSHAMIPMVTGHFGLLGLFLYFMFFLYSAWITKGHSLYAFLPAFIAGLSYIHPFVETLFVANAFIVGLYLKNKNTVRSYGVRK